MSSKKRGRKIKSANKLLKKQKTFLQALNHIQMATVIAGSCATVAAVEAASYIKAFKKGGITRAEVDTKVGEVVLNTENQMKQIEAAKGTLNIEIKNNIDGLDGMGNIVEMVKSKL